MRVEALQGPNPYSENVQAKANAPISVVNLLNRARALLGIALTDCRLETVYDRLHNNAPRIAIIGGSLDHPAHIMDWETVLMVAASIWRHGGVPFYFSIPVVCDAIAQSTLGMSYSLQSRNAVAAMVINQMEAHAYHAAYVITGCDKTPFAILAGLAHLDALRQRRGDTPLMATFHPAHVLRGGTIPPDLRAELESIAQRAEEHGHVDIAIDLRETMRYILQCTSNSAFRAVLTRAREAGLITPATHADLERRLAVRTCDLKGGICAFNGTGNSSRIALAAMGFVHPAVELLPSPPSLDQVDNVVSGLFACLTRPEYSVRHIMEKNFANAVRVYSATGGSTNLMLHLVAAMLYAGYQVDIHTIDYIRRHPPVPDIFDYSLTEGRDIFALAQQCAAGLIRGVETLFYELLQQGIPMDLEAPTVTGTTWQQRLADTDGLAAANVKENPIILSVPRRSFSGVDVLRGNFFDSAVVKISGMTDEQIDAFDEQIAIVLFFENEEEANARLLDLHLLSFLKDVPHLNRSLMFNIAVVNNKGGRPLPAASTTWDRSALLKWMLEENLLKIAVVISGQGPAACGMPEMFTPMQYINARKELQRITVLLTDGRFSGVTYGPAIGHITPEAFNGGWIGLLETGDLLYIRLRQRKIDLLDARALSVGVVVPWEGDLAQERGHLAAKRRQKLVQRSTLIAAPNRLHQAADASKGVVPAEILQEATQPYSHQWKIHPHLGRQNQ